MGIHALICPLKVISEELVLTSSGTNSQIFGAKYEIVSLP